VTRAPQPYDYKRQTVTACQTLAKASTAIGQDKASEVLDQVIQQLDVVWACG
jgi:hypothetical protein